MQSLLVFLAVIACILILGSKPQAGQGGVSPHCEKAESTADAIVCINTQNEAAQARLKKIYSTLLKQQDETAADTFEQAQKNWITYRDQQCAWEAAKVETESLRRFEELSCIASLTRQRAGILALSLEEEQDPVQEFSAYPRWANVVSHDNPKVFWQYGKHIGADLDCDDEDEQIIAGYDIQAMNVKLKDSPSHKLDFVLAVAENPATGRPKTNLFRLPVSEDQTGEGLCIPDAALTLIDHPGSSGENPEEKCKVALQIHDKTCQPLTLFWDGKDYQIKITAKEEG